VKPRSGRLPKGLCLVALVMLMAGLVAGCTPAATPTAVPTKAAAPVATTAPAGAATTAPAAAPTTAAAAPSGAPVKIGFITPLSGAQASYGALERIAVQMAVDDTNASGGINGSPLQLITDDSPFDPKQAVTSVRKQAETDKVVGIVGPYSSGEMDVAAPLSNELKLVVVSGSSTKVGVAEANRPYAFQMNVPDAVAQPPTLAGYKKLYPNVKNVVLVGDTKNAVTAAMMVDIFPKQLPQAGLTVIETIAFDTGVTDFSAIVTRIKNAKPDGIVLASLIADALTFAKELQKQQVTAPVVTDAHPIGGPIVELAGGSVDGWVMPSLFDWQNPDPKVAAWVKRYYDKAAADSAVNPKPNHLVVEASYYDTTMVMVDSLRKAGVKGTTDLATARKAVLDGFTNLKGYQGIGGVLNMLPSGNADRVAPPPFVVEKGTYKVIR